MTITQMPADQFEKFFVMALTDPSFLKELEDDPIKPLESRGVDLSGMSPEVQEAFRAAYKHPFPPYASISCGVCGVCGACGLCGGLDVGAAAVAIDALTYLIPPTR